MITGIEVGRAGLGIRVVYPVFYQGTHVGSVEFGVSYKEAVKSVTSVHKDKDAYFAIGIKRSVLEGIAFKGEKGETVGDYIIVYRDKNFNFDISKLADQKMMIADHNGHKIALTRYPIKDFSGRTIGNLFLSLDVSDYLQAGRSLSYEVSGTILAVGIVITLLIMIGLRKLLEPLNHLAEMLKVISEGKGDLTRKIDIQQEDEIGKVALYFNRFTSSLRNMINTIKEQVDINVSASSQLSSVASEISATTKSYETIIEKVKHSTEDVLQGNEEVVSNIRELIERSEEILGESENTKENLLNTIQNIDSINDRTSQLYSIVERLQKMSENIGNILTVITDIADKTNLLALNAAIEAARAGEHGRGFAVVADEVRKLAENTRKATDQIFEMISTIQEETKNAFEEMKNTKQVVDKSVETAKETSKVFEKLLELITQIRDMNQQVSQIVEKESHVVEEMRTEVTSMEEGFREIQQAIDQIDQTALQLQQTAEQIKDLIGRFKT